MGSILLKGFRVLAEGAGVCIILITTRGLSNLGDTICKYSDLYIWTERWSSRSAVGSGLGWGCLGNKRNQRAK